MRADSLVEVASEIDPYSVLGVEPGADQRTIREAYYSRARARHPDMGGDVAAMVRINAAYELIKDAKRRSAWEAARRKPRETSRSSTQSGSASATTTPAASATSATSRNAPPWTGAAGPPPGRPSGPVLNFGIFAGWSIGEIARYDPGYLAWLVDRAEGRPYAATIRSILAPMRDAARSAAAPAGKRRRFGG